ncbi:hypothetical protein YC2023_038684 [Brassica napus]
MHLFNGWLPPPVAEETKKEKESFARVVRCVKELHRPDDPESVYATLKWISVIELYVRAKSDLSVEDVTELVEIGLQIFHSSQDKLYAQVRWGNVLVRLMNKYRKKLSLKVEWRPLYDTLIHAHFSRSPGPEGWRLRQRHFEAVTSLTRSCRRFFPQGAASDIWSEFIQWAAVLARVIRKCSSIDWESYLPMLFSRFLNMFEVPVANGSGSYPFSVDVPRNTRFLFPNRTMTPSKSIAQSIVYFLKPGSSAHEQFKKLVNLLEQYYHPSNGGRWTYSLERFLLHLVVAFQKRLQREQQNPDSLSKVCLGKPERIAFVEVVLKLIDRGQYSKNEHLSETVAAATSILSYVEPSLVLPFVASRFHLALETTTATHQLKTAMMSVAFAGRSILQSYMSTAKQELGGDMDDRMFLDLIGISLSNALLGMDANDPPKTLATMQLIGSIFSNVAVLDDSSDDISIMTMASFSEWLDEFLCRLIALLQHLEPNSVINEGLSSSATSGTFLVEDGPYYYCMLEILLGRLSGSLYSQALKKISKFVRTNILPGAIAEVGLLCCACVHSNPEEAVVQIVEPMILAVISSLKDTPVTGFGGKGSADTLGSNKKDKQTLSPALEAAIDYQLKVLSVAITYGGSSLLRYKDHFIEAISSAFNSSSWKVNGAGDHLLRSLLGSLILYYPMDQYKCNVSILVRCLSRHPAAPALEEWISTKASSKDEQVVHSRWHVPTKEEIQFANELIDLHLQSALDDLLRICQSNIHSDAGDEKTHLKVTLLRIDSTLQGVLSCLPDFRPSPKHDMVEELPFFIAGASGSSVGSAEIRERTAETIHAACKYLLEKKSDDSILLVLIIRIMDALGNYGSLEYDEWYNHRQAWKLESAAIVEPPANFITEFHSKGKRRPRWALIDKAYMHNTWRSSQSSYHLFRTDGNFSPPASLALLVDDLLTLCLHNYETVRVIAGKSLLKLLKRWPPLLSKCVGSLSENLRNPDAPENVVLGSCGILSSQSVLKHLTTDPKSFSSFLLGILSSSHHESMKSQKAIIELFVKYNIHFAGLSRNILRSLDSHVEGSTSGDLVSQISSMSFDSSSLHWRYNLMANRVLLLLAMSCRMDPAFSFKILNETAGHFLKNLKSQLPQTRILAISALNTLLKESPHKMQGKDQPPVSSQENANSSLDLALSQIFQEEGFFKETFESLSHIHITDTDSSSRCNHGSSSFQSMADKSITRFYFEFSASWPRTPSWISLLGSDIFYPSFARIFKRLAQECGVPVLLALKSPLEEFCNAKERPKQCVAAETLAGLLHSDVNGLQSEWDSWIMVQLQNVILGQSVESIPEWATCIRYAVTGKGKQGTKIPMMRQQILDCIVAPLPPTATTTVVSKRYAFLSAALIELSPPKMPVSEVKLHIALLDELIRNMSHSSAQIREAIGVILSVLCSNIRLRMSYQQKHPSEEGRTDVDSQLKEENWFKLISARASEAVTNIQQASISDSMDTSADVDMENGDSLDDVKWMETLFHFIISSFKSGRSSYLGDVIAGFLYPVISLQETSHKDLSTLAKAAFELLKWRVFPGSHLQKVIEVILSSADDSNWRIRSSTLTYLRTFMYRHTFILAHEEKQKIWKTVEKLLVDSQVREHAAAVLAGLMKGGDEDFAADFRDRSYAEANSIQKKRNRRKSSSTQSIATVHGAVLGLVASVLSVPYDMPSWLPDHVTLLARFAGEPTPVKSTVTKAVAEFRRTHADTWNIQKDSFTEEQLEVLADTSSSSSYFA